MGSMRHRREDKKTALYKPLTGFNVRETRPCSSAQTNANSYRAVAYAILHLPDIALTSALFKVRADDRYSVKCCGWRWTIQRCLMGTQAQRDTQQLHIHMKAGFRENSQTQCGNAPGQEVKRG